MRILLLLLINSATLFSQPYRLINISNAPDCSFRGLTVVNDTVAWVSGSKGYIGISKNNGTNWSFFQVKAYETLDFRSIYSFDKQKAVIANAGSPAVILITEDEGITWKEAYRNENKDAFIDGLIFWNEKDGLAFGDPINNRMLLLRTTDGGNSWKEIPEKQRPGLSEGEASFAASGTTIRYLGKGKIVIATGGKVSQLWTSYDYGESWKPSRTPIIQGKATTGIFSMAFKNNKTGIIVGGDYKDDTLKTEHIFLTKDEGRTWQKPKTPTGGYRSCVEYVSAKVIIATGTSGTDISYDAGKTWQSLSTEGYNVIMKARAGNLVILAGDKGKIAVLKRILK